MYSTFSHNSLSSFTHPFIRGLRNGEKAPSKAISELQHESPSGSLLGGEGDGASGDDSFPACQLGKNKFVNFPLDNVFNISRCFMNLSFENAVLCCSTHPQHIASSRK